MGNVYFSSGKNDQAMDSYNQALAMRRAVQDRYGEFNGLL
jgi:predicted negative regulator of RcsB-dependent stress response